METKINRKIKLLILCDEIIQTTAGSEQHISFLQKNLPKNIYEIYFALLRNRGALPSNAFPMDPTILDFYSFKSPKQVIKAVKALRRILQEKKIEVLYTFFPDSELLGILTSKALSSCKLIVSRRNMGYANSRHRRLRNCLTNLFVPFFIVNCQAIKKQLMKKELVAEKKIRVIYNPINQMRIDYGQNDAIDRKSLGILENEFIIGIVANIRPVKDYETFIQAAKIVCDTIQNSKFLVVGSETPEYKKQLDSLISQLGLDKTIIFTGPIENPIPLIRLFHVGVLTSKSEGLSNTLIEYGAVGIPSVATDVGGSGEIITDGETGYLVPPGSPKKLAQKIIEILNNNRLRVKLGENARQHVMNKLNQNEIIRQYQEFHRSVLLS